MESIIEKYKPDLDSGENVHIALSRIYGEMFEQNVTQKTYAMFGKLSKVYPVKFILLALLDMYDMENVNYTNIYPLIVHLIKSRVEKSIKPNKEIYLNERARKIKEEYQRE